nr:unnamed protein product [Callosobruchus chinensis]
MAFDSQFMIIKGSVHASMRDRVYKVERAILVSAYGSIGYISYQNISTTDVACSWTNKKPVEGNVKTVAELFPKKKVHQSITENIPDSKIDEFKANLSIYKSAVGLCWLLKEDPKIMDQLVDVESLVFSGDYLKADDKEAYLLNALS